VSAGCRFQIWTPILFGSWSSSSGATHPAAAQDRSALIGGAARSTGDGAARGEFLIPAHVGLQFGEKFDWMSA